MKRAECPKILSYTEKKFWKSEQENKNYIELQLSYHYVKVQPQYSGCGFRESVAFHAEIIYLSLTLDLER